VQDFIAQREKLLAQAADCELIAQRAPDAAKTFRAIAEQLKQMAAQLADTIVKREG
jgi:hypothetical protein